MIPPKTIKMKRIIQEIKKMKITKHKKKVIEKTFKFQ